MEKHIELLKEIQTFQNELFVTIDEQEIEKISLSFRSKYLLSNIEEKSTYTVYKENILHMFYKKFLKKQSFVDKYYKQRAISQSQTRNKKKIMTDSKYNFYFYKESLRDAFESYSNPQMLINFFDTCESTIGINLEAKLPITVEIALNIILANVIRCFGISTKDLANSIRLIRNKDNIKYQMFKDVFPLQVLEELFEDFCISYTKNPKFHYLHRLNCFGNNKVQESLLYDEQQKTR